MNKKVASLRDHKLGKNADKMFDAVLGKSHMDTCYRCNELKKISAIGSGGKRYCAECFLPMVIESKEKNEA